MGRGKCNCNMSDSVGTEKILQVRDLLVPHRLSTEAISLSMHSNDTHPYIKLNHEPKNFNPNSYQVVAHFYVEEGRGPLPNLHLLVMCYVPLSFVLLMHYLYL